jgi:hypothetical protein
MHYLLILTIQILDQEVFSGIGGVETGAEHLCSGGPDLGVVGGCEGQEGGGLDGVFVVGYWRGRGYGAALWGDVRRVVDLGEVSDVLEAVGDLLHGYEGEDA